MRRKILVLLIIVILSVSACSQNEATKVPDQSNTASSQKAEYHKITAEQAKTIIDGKEDIIILDVRTPAEYKEMHIERAVNISNEDIGTDDLPLLPDKNAKILVYCRSGRRSLDASQELLKMGYQNIYDFGGIIDWPFETVE